MIWPWADELTGLSTRVESVMIALAMNTLTAERVNLDCEMARSPPSSPTILESTALTLINRNGPPTRLMTGEFRTTTSETVYGTPFVFCSCRRIPVPQFSIVPLRMVLPPSERKTVCTPTPEDPPPTRLCPPRSKVTFEPRMMPSPDGQWRSAVKVTSVVTVLPHVTTGAATAVLPPSATETSRAAETTPEASALWIALGAYAVAALESPLTAWCFPSKRAHVGGRGLGQPTGWPRGTEAGGRQR